MDNKNFADSLADGWCERLEIEKLHPEASVEEGVDGGFLEISEDGRKVRISPELVQECLDELLGFKERS